MRNILFVLLSGVLLFIYGCGDMIAQLNKIGKKEEGFSAKKLVPAEVNVTRFKKIAILDFDGKGGREIAELLENELQNVRVGDRPFFEVINRSKIMKLLAEQRLSMTGLIDPDMAAKIGKISGTQAIVTGRVPAFRINENRYYREQERYRGERRIIEKVPCRELNAYVDFNVSFMDSKTGQIMAATSAEGQVIGDSCKQVGGALEALFGVTKKETENFKAINIELNEVPEKMLKEAAKMAIAQFVKKITPHYEVVPITILDSEISGFAGASKEQPANERLIEAYYGTGYKYAIRSQWEDAIKQWEKILEIENRRPAAIYNLGVAFEMTGDLFLAEKQFKTAVEIRPDDLFFDALARVRKSIDERKKIAQQVPGPQGRSSSIPEPKPSIEQKPIPLNDGKDKEPSVESPQKDSSSLVKIKSGSVKVRKLRSNKAKVLSILKKGDEVERMEEEGDWLKIRFENKGTEEEGWIIKYDCEGYSKTQKLKKKQTPLQKEKTKKVSPL